VREQKDEMSELRRRRGEYYHDEIFVDPKDKRPDVVAEADL